MTRFAASAPGDGERPLVLGWADAAGAALRFCPAEAGGAAALGGSASLSLRALLELSSLSASSLLLASGFAAAGLAVTALRLERMRS